MRPVLIGLVLLLSPSLFAQLTVGSHLKELAGTQPLMGEISASERPSLSERTRRFRALRTRVPARLPDRTGKMVDGRTFDYRRAQPHLAFFCRLELNIESATRFPVRFRLGEVRTWQQRLSKRD